MDEKVNTLLVFSGNKKRKKGGITTVIAGYNVIKKIH